MKIKDFIELSNQELVNYLKERLSQFTEPIGGREEVYDAIDLDRNSFWNYRSNSNVIKKTLRHGISSYLVSDTYVSSITGKLTCYMAFYRYITKNRSDFIGSLEILNDRVEISTADGYIRDSLHDLVYEDKRFY